jgi:DNA-binding response OmpR family regulator
VENILIVVSDVQLLGDLSDCCLDQGLTPHGLTHGSYALPWIGERAAGAIILDTQAAGDNGAAFYRAIGASCSAPLFMLTQNNSETEKLETANLRVKAFFSKPFEAVAVVSQIKSLLS